MKELLTALAVNTRENLWKIEELKDKARNLESEDSRSETEDSSTEQIVAKLREGTGVLMIFSELVKEVEGLIEKFKD